jgi:hypothetical protein
MLEFLKKILGFLHDNNIEYMLSGSFAMSVYALPRSTRDFDFVVNISEEHVDLICSTFSADYYCEKSAVEEAIKRKSLFHIIDFNSGFKADFMVLKNSEYRKIEFDRKIKHNFIGIDVFIVALEDLIISKLIWCQDTQSSVQIEDIDLLLSLEGIDRNYINHWVNSLKLNTFGIEKLQ